MGGAQVFQLRELDSDIFYFSGAALAGVPRAARFHSARLVTELGELTELGSRLPGSGPPRCAPGPCLSSAAAAAAMPCIALPCELMCARPFACRRDWQRRRARLAGSTSPPSREQLLGCREAAYCVRRISRGGGSGGCCCGGCCCGGGKRRGARRRCELRRSSLQRAR